MTATNAPRSDRGATTRRPVRIFLTALLTVALTVSLLFRRDMHAADARIAAGRRVAETACGPVEYGESGRGPAALAIHGAGGGFDQGLFVGRRLLGDAYRVVAPSRFGYLEGGLPADRSIEAQADAYACLLDALGVGNVVVLGFSAGGPSALQFALRHPDRTRALVLAAAVSFTEPVGAEDRTRVESGINRIVGSDLLYWLVEQAAPGTFLELIGVPPAFQRAMPPEDRETTAETLRLMHPMSRRFSGIALDQSREVPRDWPLDRIAAPTAVLHARDDGLVPFANAEHSAARIPGAALMALDRGSHLLLGDAAALGALRRWLAAHP